MTKRFPYSFLEEAAAKARQESRRYWAKGGEADTKHPRQSMKGWFIPLADDPDARIRAAINRMKGRKYGPPKDD